MGGNRTAGFTIIESILFFAISGALVIGILGGAGYAINVQRYRDATTSLVSYLQGQYDLVINVQNDRDPHLACDIIAKIHDAGASNRPAGMTECAIVGRFIQTTDGVTYTSSQVFADVKKSVVTDDVTSLVDAQPFSSPAFVESTTYSLAWGTRAVLPPPDSDTPMAPFSMLIVRAPASGTVMTFIGNTSADTPQSLVVDPSAQRQAVICLDSQGLFNGERSGAIVLRGAANSSGVKEVAGGEC